MRILLTGATGFIGGHILEELLDAGHFVTAPVRSTHKLCRVSAHARLQIVEADLRDDSALARLPKRHDVCVHAALIWGEPSSELELKDTAVAAKLFDSSGRAGTARCIYISSVAVHRPFQGEMSEDDRLSATDFYGATKAAGELFLRAACATHCMSGVVVRPGPVVGPPAFNEGAFGSDRRIAEIVAAARENRPILVPTDPGRQLSDARAVARTIRELTTLQAPFPTYICVDREITTWEAIAQLAVSATGSSSDVLVQGGGGAPAAPRFVTDRIEGLHGGPLTSHSALLAHIRHLARTG